MTTQLSKNNKLITVLLKKMVSKPSPARYNLQNMASLIQVCSTRFKMLVLRA